jgi:hypothetical protein
MGRSLRAPKRWISSPNGARRGSGEGPRRLAPSLPLWSSRAFVRFGMCDSPCLDDVSAAAAASRGERDRLVRAPAGRADDGAAEPGPDHQGIPRSRNSRTSLRRAHSSGRPDVEHRRHGDTHAATATSRNSRCGRSLHTGAGETTSHPRRGIRRSPIRSAVPRDRSRCHPPCGASPTMERRVGDSVVARLMTQSVVRPGRKPVLRA